MVIYVDDLSARHGVGPELKTADLSHLATIAGLESSIRHLSALFNEQLLLLEEVEEKLGVDGMGNELNDGECVLIDRIREHLEAMAQPTRTAPQAQKIAGNGSDTSPERVRIGALSKMAVEQRAQQEIVYDHETGSNTWRRKKPSAAPAPQQERF